MMHNKFFISGCIVFFLASVFSACSLNKMAVKMVADTLSSSTSGQTFTGDDDPELVGDALPFALKLFESLIAEMKDNPGLYLTTGSGFIMYANVWVQAPADMLPDSEFMKKKEMTARSRKLYIRGRNYVLQGLEVKYPGFRASLDAGDQKKYLAGMKKEDVPFLYWAAAGWIAAYAADPFDVDMGIGVKNATRMIDTALNLDGGFGEGSIHDLLISYYGSLPQAMGGSEEKARYHFERAVEFSRGKKSSPYVALASSVSIKNQNIKEFILLLDKALAINVDENPGNRLANIIAQRKARWLLDHRKDKFLSDAPGEKK
jgi:predicted anti-sigma-YlaC factor YlaD